MRAKPVAIWGLFALLLLGLGGCLPGFTSSSSLTQENLQTKLIAGKTTQSEVRQLYGEPSSIKNTKSGQTWVYAFEPAKLDGAASAAASTATNLALAHGTANAMLAGGKAGGATGAALAGAGTQLAGNQLKGALTNNGSSKTLIVNFNKSGILTSYKLQ